MKKIFYSKLVRDNIPSIIAERGSRCSIKRLPKKAFEKALLKKVGEEASGILAARTRRELILEFADVVDVLEEIKKIKKISAREVTAARRTNFKRKGGFKKRLFLTWSSDDGYTSNESKK
jgi:predicted house-cleaning noncanonical NTP pyrophosphatase (MazG superfamily)